MSRANQSAINRRAGGQQQQMPPPPPGQQRQSMGIPSQQMMQQQRQQQMAPGYVNKQVPGQGPVKSVSYQEPMQQPQMNSSHPARKGKITVSDAIALTTLRLGRVEQIIEQWQNEGHQPRGDLNPDGNIAEPNVDSSVIMSIISRIENLEKRPLTTTGVAFDIRPTDEKIEGLKQEVLMLKKMMSGISQEISQIKDNASKLQMFTMETNQKLISAVMSQPQPQPQPQPITSFVTPSLETHEEEMYIDNSCLNSDFNYSPDINDLKEYIKNELVDSTTNLDDSTKIEFEN